MKTPRRDSTSKVESQLPVATAIATRFSAGLNAGLDPDADYNDISVPKNKPQRVTTTLRSRWLHRLCPTCQQTFRAGDDVLLSTDGEVVHAMADLCSAGVETKTGAGTSDHEAFFRGLNHAWPIPDDVPVTHLEDGHWLLMSARAGFPDTRAGSAATAFALAIASLSAPVPRTNHDVVLRSTAIRSNNATAGIYGKAVMLATIAWP